LAKLKTKFDKLRVYIHNINPRSSGGNEDRGAVPAELIAVWESSGLALTFTSDKLTATGYGNAEYTASVNGNIISVCPQSRLLCGQTLHFLA
jgi:hypothetical protein